MSGTPAWRNTSNNAGKYANQYNHGGSRETPENVIRSSGWQEHSNKQSQASSSSQSSDQYGNSWRPSLYGQSESYNREHLASGSTSWTDPPDRAHLASGGTGQVGWDDYVDDRDWYSGGGYGSDAGDPWHQEGEPDDHWQNQYADPCQMEATHKAAPLKLRTVGPPRGTAKSKAKPRLDKRADRLAQEKEPKEPVAKRAKQMVWRALGPFRKVAEQIAEMHVRERSEPRPEAGQNFAGISDTRFNDSGILSVEVESASDGIDVPDLVEVDREHLATGALDEDSDSEDDIADDLQQAKNLVLEDAPAMSVEELAQALASQVYERASHNAIEGRTTESIKLLLFLLPLHLIHTATLPSRLGRDGIAVVAVVVLGMLFVVHFLSDAAGTTALR